MSVPPVDRYRPAEGVAGLMASAAIFAGVVALAYRPLRIAPFAMLVAIIAAGLGGRHSKLATFAVAATTICWILGMTIAILTASALY